MIITTITTTSTVFKRTVAATPTNFALVINGGAFDASYLQNDAQDAFIYSADEPEKPTRYTLNGTSLSEVSNPDLAWSGIRGADLGSVKPAMQLSRDAEYLSCSLGLRNLVLCEQLTNPLVNTFLECSNSPGVQIGQGNVDPAHCSVVELEMADVEY